jgi:hypothetical protein
MAAEVRLLLRLQEEILASTRRLADAKSRGITLSDEQISELNQLRDRQKRLAQAARSMIGNPEQSGRPAGSVEEVQP